MHFNGLWTAKSEGYVMKPSNPITPYENMVFPSKAASLASIVALGLGGAWCILKLSFY